MTPWKPYEGRRKYAHLYTDPMWKRLRKLHLAKHPSCQCEHCKGEGKPLKDRVGVPDHERAIVDHIRPHKGRRKLFFDRDNLQTMSKECHDKFKQSEERGGAGFKAGCDETGQPLSREHEWYGFQGEEGRFRGGAGG